MIIVIILAVKKVNGLAVMAIAGLLGGFFCYYIWWTWNRRDNECYGFWICI